MFTLINALLCVQASIINFSRRKCPPARSQKRLLLLCWKLEKHKSFKEKARSRRRWLGRRANCVARIWAHSPHHYATHTPWVYKLIIALHVCSLSRIPWSMHAHQLCVYVLFMTACVCIYAQSAPSCLCLRRARPTGDLLSSCVYYTNGSSGGERKNELDIFVLTSKAAWP